MFGGKMFKDTANSEIYTMAFLKTKTYTDFRINRVTARQKGQESFVDCQHF